MGRRNYAVLLRTEPECPEIREDFLEILRRGLLLALKEEGFLNDLQLRQALAGLKEGGKL